MLVLILILVLGFGTLFYTLVGSARLGIESDRITDSVLAQAKEALIGYAAQDSNRPGSMPCPDTNNDGSAELFSGSECPSYIGRLPWRTLGLPDLRDGNGERLWYAVTREYARNPSCGSACPLNSDTKGTLTITGNGPASDVVAVVFSAGNIVGTQVRDAANQNTIANYLEGGNEIGIATSTFVTGLASSIFNDRLLIVTGSDVMTPVERRAAAEMLALLRSYRTASGSVWLGCDCYPWPDISDGSSNTGQYYGRVPLLTAAPHTWASLGLSVPAWLTTNRWWWVFFYTVSQSQSESHGGGTITVDGTSGYSVVLITTGPAATGRPVTVWGGDSDWDYYIDDPNNSDMGTTFITPSSTAYARDRLYKL